MNLAIVDLAIVVGIIAGVVQLWGYWLHNKTATHTDSAVSWAIWGLGSFITWFLYAELVNDWVKEFLPLLCMFAAFATFLRYAFKGYFSKPDKIDLFVLVLDVIIIAYWFVYQEATWANLFIQIDVIISFIPMLRSVWKKPHSEDPKPWLVWSVAYLLLTLTVIMRWESWWELLYPLNYFVLHFAVWMITKFRRDLVST